MNPAIINDDEIKALWDDPRIVELDALEQWQIDALTSSWDEHSLFQANSSLQAIDCIVWDWLKALTKEEWAKIKRQNSLYGIKLPDNWIKVWRLILKEPELRDARTASRNGNAIGSYTHLWNLWSEDCIKKYLSPMEKEIIQLVDEGFLYSEIGEIMLGKYGDEFWKPRKENTKTTPSQVINNYLYWKMPNKIARAELTDLVRIQLELSKKYQKV